MSSKLKQFGLVLSGVCLGVLISLNYSANATRETPVALPVEEARNLADVFNAIKQYYVEPVEDKKLISDAISGMVSGLDPHSVYLDADALKDLEVSTKGEFGGLGIEVSMEDGFVKVVSPIEDTPAFRAGVKAGDLIVKLDDQAVKGMSLNEAVKHMRGKPKTQIVLTIARKGENKPIILTLTREIIKVQSVKSKLIEPGYGYLRVTQFQEQTTADVARHMERMYKQGQLKGLVLDLRNDPGGLLNSAIGVSAAFLPAKSLVVYTDGRTDDAKRKFHAVPDDYMRGSREDVLKGLPEALKNVPMVVIVNGGSASASEIVAGALQDYKRAKVLGIQTFGKGSVQTILPISSTTGIKITTAKYFTPTGRSIQAKGIVPDYIVDESPNGSGADVYLREADLSHHLANPNDPSSSAPAATPSQSKPSSKEKDKEKGETESVRYEFGGKGDYQLEQAMNLLKGLPVAVVPVAASQSTPAGDKP
ncbi:S41 family peptidase [Uliginosibacterium gangwonense]|uniref:S41 family peptidase n=1 Tax=Uliginosibacterium gangwonense TaxID=392736 RepID=UPI000368DAF5|nr:S41 family peptidase [Uliginosibacterium gangwonense]